MLYPTLEFDPVFATDVFLELPAGTLAIIPLDMTIVTKSTITLAQASLTQDFSLRAWISVLPNGSSVVGPPNNIIPVLRGYGLPIVVYVVPQSPPVSSIPIAINAGQYFINVLNLTNEKNIFIFGKTDI